MVCMHVCECICIPGSVHGKLESVDVAAVDRRNCIPGRRYHTPDHREACVVHNGQTAELHSTSAHVTRAMVGKRMYLKQAFITCSVVINQEVWERYRHGVFLLIYDTIRYDTIVGI